MSLSIYQIDGQAGIEIPFFDVGVAAGDPSYVQEYFPDSINISQELVKNPKATFCVRVSGQSMVGAGIDDGDLLIVDKELQARDGQIILAVINGDYTVKRLLKKEDGYYLQPENPAFQPLRITQFMDFRIWGVVTGLIKKMA
jgi:DNA polymerase V